ncbi:amidohydrolase family protein [Brevundimonas sp.]|uniref:amidohydrolase family protein n=1 Tax=Brevundimonas sp. TaxID=1871086 RepID=UPI003566DFBC
MTTARGILAGLALALAAGTALAQIPAPPEAQAAPAPRRPAWLAFDEPVILIRDVSLVDGTGAPARPGMSVLIRDGRIDGVGPDLAAPEGARVIEGAGKTLTPGLVLMHEHMFYPTGRDNYGEMSFSFPRLYLAGGVTTLRTAGSMSPYADLNLRTEIAAGRTPGPDMDVTAPYLNGPGLPIVQVNALEGADDAERMVNYWAAEGATSYKTYMQITRAELGRVVELAHARGQKVTGHLCSVTYREAADLGIDNLEHGFFASTDFVADKQPDVCPDQAATLTALATIDPASPEVQALIRRLVDKGVVLTSTLTIIETLTTGRPKAPEAALELLTPPVRAQYEQVWPLVQQRPGDEFRNLLANMMRLERAFADAGGTLVAGTDPTGYGGVIPGFSSRRQLQLMLEAGFDFETVVRIASLNGARFLGRDAEVGSIEAGKRADLILIDGDPSTDPTALDRFQYVFKSGVGYDPAVILTGLKGTVGLH